MTAPATANGGGPGPVHVGLVCGFLVGPTALGFSAAPVALPSLAKELGVGVGNTAWVLAAYSLTTAILTAFVGRFADLRGLRLPLFVAAGALVLGSIDIAVSTNLGWVILGRLVQGVGAGGAGVIAFRLPAALVSNTAARGKALGTLGIVVGLMSGAGPLLGGLLTDATSWRMALSLPVLSLVSVPFLLWMMPDLHVQGGELDIRGALLCTTFIASLTLLIQARSAELSTVVVVVAVVVVGASFVALGHHQRKRPDGFLPGLLLANDRFRRAAAIGFTLFAGYLILQFAAPRLLLAQHPHSPTELGLILLPAGLASAGVSRGAGALIPRFGPWRIVVVLTTASALGLVLASALPHSPVAVVITLAVCVSGFSAGQVTLMSAQPASAGW